MYIKRLVQYVTVDGVIHATAEKAVAHVNETVQVYVSDLIVQCTKNSLSFNHRDLVSIVEALVGTSEKMEKFSKTLSGLIHGNFAHENEHIVIEDSDE